MIAFVGESGFNPLHADFALPAGEELRFPPGMPRPVWVTLPSHGSFEERLAAAQKGTLGDLETDTLYWIRGTRVGIYIPNDGVPNTDVLADREHGTGVVSSGIGLEHGTDPHALGIFVPSTQPSAWKWLASQAWVDMVSTSWWRLYAIDGSTATTCPALDAIESFAETGRPIFSSSGNTEQAGLMTVPSGTPFTYQVGGVDDQGKTYIPTDPRSGTPTRPYETGDRFDFPAADFDSAAGSMPFGGTSGATPSTAGRVAGLITFARGLLGSSWTGVRGGALAVAADGVRIPRSGPLADGRLEKQELVDLLHHVATPAEPPSPARYLVEGYGALDEDAITLAKRVLAGTATEPERPEEDAMNETVESLRSAFFSDGRCD